MNMKKNINITTVIIVLAIFITLSVGYALFSDTITIEGTATAQGEFDVSINCVSGISPELGVTVKQVSSDVDTESGFDSEYCVVNGLDVEYGADLKYPSSLKIYTIEITNNNDFSVKVDETSVNADSKKYIDDILVEDEDTYGAIQIYDVANHYIISNGVVSEWNDLIIEPGETVYLVEGLYWSKYDDGSITNGTDVTFKKTFHADLIQVAE